MLSLLFLPEGRASRRCRQLSRSFYPTLDGRASGAIDAYLAFLAPPACQIHAKTNHPRAQVSFPALLIFCNALHQTKILIGVSQIDFLNDWAEWAAHLGDLKPGIGTVGWKQRETPE